MKKLLFVFAVCFSIGGFSQETEYKKYSYAEFFEMIEKEQDTIFKLKNAIISYNKETDSLMTTVKEEFLNPIPLQPSAKKREISKHIELENIFFSIKYNQVRKDSDTTEVLYMSGALVNLHFKKSVRLTNVLGLRLYESVFDDRFYFRPPGNCETDRDFLTQNEVRNYTDIGLNHFKKGISIFYDCRQNIQSGFYQMFKNRIETSSITDDYSLIYIRGLANSMLVENEILGDGQGELVFKNCPDLTVVGNSMESIRSKVLLNGDHDNWVFKENTFENGFQFSITNLKPSDVIDYHQFDEKTFSSDSYVNYISLFSDEDYEKVEKNEFILKYRNELRYQDPAIFAGESALKGVLYRHYRENFNMQSANKAYIDLKDFETKHLEYLFDTKPSFDTYFQWKVNQFLKVFSNYGTKPSKAIVFSVYVIFFFALIYLFFPNSWDKHGKNRIVDRYNFFFKYMKQKNGIHEVYLDDQREELMTYEQFKSNILDSNQKVPRFFTATALPLYKWAVSGTKLSAAVLKRLDILKGSWNELPRSKRWWKSALLVGAFTIAIIYDLCIKVLNALMLSINTFTTLGFGEIPIKGLPRYLAIIQGFIGWFMLTIFSVSLISQLLN